MFYQTFWMKQYTVRSKNSVQAKVNMKKLCLIDVMFMQLRRKKVITHEDVDEIAGKSVKKELISKQNGASKCSEVNLCNFLAIRI